MGVADVYPLRAAELGIDGDAHQPAFEIARSAFEHGDNRPRLWCELVARDETHASDAFRDEEPAVGGEGERPRGLEVAGDRLRLEGRGRHRRWCLCTRRARRARRDDGTRRCDEQRSCRWHRGRGGGNSGTSGRVR
jgi:hypothetical protein